MTTRRNFIRTGSILGIASIAGCSSNPFTSSRGVILGDVIVANETRYPQSIHIEILREEATLVDTTLQFEPGPAVHRIEPEWSIEKAVYVIRAEHTDKEDVYERTFDAKTVEQYELEDESCLPVHVRIGLPFEKSVPPIYINPDPSVSAADCSINETPDTPSN
ncbi:hypothetical protein [Haloferax sp. KTX1]|uniref:hypothetical protein n=1 Tax=Haloferax sp. KTX1 TaxID=2600597 RepID=UPI0011DD0D69|nr:hypothetical protein [Haloferax sp. KTX1]